MTAAEKRRRVEQLADQQELALLLADGFDAAIVGLVELWMPVGQGGAQRTSLVCYDREKCVTVLMKRDGMAREEAEEFFDFNVADAYHGTATPVFLTALQDEH